MSVFVDELLRATVAAEASDLHMTAGSPPLVRVHGILNPLPLYDPMTDEDIRVVLEALVPDQEDLDRFRSQWELDFAHTIPGLTRFRGNACMQRGTVKISLRVLPLEIPTPDDLGLPAVVKTLAEQPKGLVLVCGPTGSGKSTTLAAMINHINTTQRRIIVTVEDPIEYLHQDLNSVIIQREVGTDTKDFLAALRHALRQDPDVILVGEMRDQETIGLAITAAETGHLVLSTLHANSTSEAVDRIVDVFPPTQQSQIRVQLSMSLAGIIYQVLLPKTGGLGRVAACEVLIATMAVRNLVRQGRSEQLPSYLQTGRSLGMQTLEQAIQELIRQDLVDPDKVAQYLNSYQDLFNPESSTVGASDFR